MIKNLRPFSTNFMNAKDAIIGKKRKRAEQMEADLPRQCSNMREEG